MSAPSLRPLDANWTDSGVISALKRLAARCDAAAPLVDQACNLIFMPCWTEAVALSGRTDDHMACLRIKVGTILEDFAIRECKKLTELASCARRCSATVQGRVSQLYFDAYAVAVWTSAHVEWLASKQANIEEPPAPNLLSIPNAFASYDMSGLYSRRTHPKSCPKETGPLLQLMARCTNPGARGWDPVLTASLKTPGIRRIITREFEICLTGLHPQLHPSLRPNWKMRYKLIRTVAECCSNDRTNADIIAVSVQSKEVIRRMLAGSMSSCMAMHVALSRLGHPVRHLHQPPMNIPHIGMEAAMGAFLQAGIALSNDHSLALCDAINRAFTNAQRRDDGFGWVVGWLGKGTSDCTSRTTLVELSSSVWSSTFKTNFIAFWMHGMSKKLRVSRLDDVQHQAIHSMNSVTKLCAALPTEEQLRIQRIVLCDPTAPTKTLEEAARDMGISSEGITIPTAFKNNTEALAVIHSLGARSAAMLFTYARVAWVKEQVFTVDLGAQVEKQQIQALLRRMRRPPMSETASYSATAALPCHATNLCICTSCQRVANAHVSNGVGDKPVGIFNEIGVSQSMIRWHSIHEPGLHLCCAKRSSAALRTAIGFQTYMRKRKLEDEDVETEALDNLMALRTATSVESGIAARVRRDAKNALEQRPVAAACSESTMLNIPIIGKAVRVYDNFYALCCYCACVTRVTNAHRYGSEICCLSCDHQCLYRKEDGEGLVERAAQKKVDKVCRFCGEIDPEKTGARWKEVKAPLDVAGLNVTLPRPLRNVYYCPLHYKPWLGAVHRVMETRIILAHLAIGAKPVCFGDGDGGGEEGAIAGATGVAAKSIQKRRVNKRA